MTVLRTIFYWDAIMPSVKNIVVVDTVGGINSIRPDYLSLFPFVKEWNGYEPSNVAGTVPHPHGGMCMGEILLALWNDPSDIRAHFVRIFDSSGSSCNDNKWLEETIRVIAASGPTWVNNSWGAYIGSRPIPGYHSSVAVWRKLIEETGITVMWAAGNKGNWTIDVDEELPQGALTDISSKIAAGTVDGFPAVYSGDSTQSPPLATFWSTKIRLINPVTGGWDVASGTSFAAPKATGLAAKRNLDYAGFRNLAISKCIVPADYPGNLPHPKWGYGWMEDEYQTEIKDCPYRYECTAGQNSPAARAPVLEWFEFELRQASVIKDVLGQ